MENRDAVDQFAGFQAFCAPTKKLTDDVFVPKADGYVQDTPGWWQQFVVQSPAIPPGGDETVADPHASPFEIGAKNEEGLDSTSVTPFGCHMKCSP